jgi:hypothetical protein
MIVTPEEAAYFLAGAGANDADPTFRRIVFAVNKEVEESCGRQFTKEARTEVVRGWGKDVIFLREAPIITLTEVRIDWTGEFPSSSAVADLTRFKFSGEPGDHRLFYLDGIFPEGPRTVRVTYTGGYEAAPTNAPPTLLTMPEDLRGVVFDEIAQRWKRGTSEQMKSETIGSYSYTRFDAADSPAAKVLRRYRR